MSVHWDAVRVPALFASESLVMPVRLRKEVGNGIVGSMRVRLPVALRAVCLFDLLVGSELCPIQHVLDNRRFGH
jgi:hypothetical protein